MTGPCACWVAVSAHEGHCCYRNADDDLTTCHEIEGVAMGAEADVGGTATSPQAERALTALGLLSVREREHVLTTIARSHPAVVLAAVHDEELAAIVWPH